MGQVGIPWANPCGQEIGVLWLARSEPLKSTVLGSGWISRLAALPDTVDGEGADPLRRERYCYQKKVGSMLERLKQKTKNKWLLGQASLDFKITGKGSNYILTGMEDGSCCLTPMDPQTALLAPAHIWLDILVLVSWLFFTVICSAGSVFNHALFLVFSCISFLLLVPVLCITTALGLDGCLPWIWLSKPIFLESLSYRICSS